MVWILSMFLTRTFKPIQHAILSYWGYTVQVIVFYVFIVILFMNLCSHDMVKQRPYNYVYALLYTITLLFTMIHINLRINDVGLYILCLDSLSLIPFMIYIRIIKSLGINKISISLMLLCQWIFYGLFTILVVYSQYSINTLATTTGTSILSMYTLFVIYQYDSMEFYSNDDWLIASMDIYSYWIRCVYNKLVDG